MVRRSTKEILSDVKLAVRAYASNPSPEHAETVKLTLSRKRELDAQKVQRELKSRTKVERNV